MTTVGWGDGDQKIISALGQMFDFANHSKAATLTCDETVALANVLARRIHESCDESAVKALGEAVNKETWVTYGCSQITASTYEADKDSAEKVVEALQVTLLTKQEFDVYKGDFDSVDSDGDGFLDIEEVKKMLTKQLEREPTEGECQAFIKGFDRNKDGKVSFEEYMTRLCGKYDLTGLSDEEAMEGFLEELNKVPANVARSGLAGGDFKGKPDELAKLSDAEVLDAYKKQSLEVWATMTDDTNQQGEMLAELLGKLEKMGDTEGAAKLREMLEASK